MASMKDVAKLAGVSVMTVSRVVNQNAPVDDQTRQKVEEAIQKLNYTPNLLARGLRQKNGPGPEIPAYAVYENYRRYAQSNQTYQGNPGQGKKIGFANVGMFPFCFEVEKSIIKQAELAGFDKHDVFILNNRYTPEIGLKNAERMLRERLDIFIEFQADSMTNNIVAAKLGEAQIPIIAIDIPVPGAPFMGINNWQVATMGGKAMVDLIMQKWGGAEAVDLIVLLQNPAGGDMTMLRSEGFATTLVEEFGDRIEEKIIRVDGGMGRPDQAQEAMESVLDIYPDAVKIAVTSVNEETMSGVIAALQDADRWNKDDIIVVTLGVDDLGKLQIRRGLSDAGVAFFPEKYGEYLIPAACAILEGAPVPSHLYVENEIITLENIDQYYPL